MMGLNKARLLSNIRWLGREGSNLRMAESKSAALPLGYAPTGRTGTRGRMRLPDRFGQRPVYRGCQAISTGWNPEFRPKSAPGSMTHYNEAACTKIPARLQASGRGPRLPI